MEKAVLIKEIWLENSVSAIEHIGNRKSIFEIPPVIKLTILHTVVVIHYTHRIQTTCLIKEGKAVKMLKDYSL